MRKWAKTIVAAVLVVSAWTFHACFILGLWPFEAGHLLGPQSCAMRPVYSSDTVKIVCGDETVFEMALVASGVDTGIMLGRTPGTALLYHDGFDVAAMRWTVAK